MTKSRFGCVPLGELCEKCNLDSPNIVVQSVCSSQRQLWSIFFCLDCGMRGLMNVSVNENILELYQWNSNAPAAKYWCSDWAGDDVG